ncbi:cytochrome P450 [Nocardia sp. NPDC046473]|uniref:cytochrome P450 family protein n=1 Tax=Nocardia sp. NPDC046473 TaxID=3155733 RepID=UPI0033FCCDDD
MNLAASTRIEALDADFHANPHRYYHRWREQGPVLRVSAPSGVVSWLVVGYAEARAALRDPRLRKSADGIQELFRRKHPTAPANAPLANLDHNMANSDSPQHIRLRKLVNKAFTHRAIAELRPHIEETTQSLLDEMAEHDEIDLLAAFVFPLPVRMICDMLGVPRSDVPGFQQWARKLFQVVGDERADAFRELRSYLRELVVQKRAHPGADLLSKLIHARDNGDSLSEVELLDMAVMLLVSGHGTTVDLLTTGSLALLRDDSLSHTLRANPSALPAAVDEFLRFDGPIHFSTIRYTAEPVLIGDTEIPAGEFVHIAVAAANHDPAIFPEPDRLDIGRDAGQHLSFGHGAHFCVGAPLARMEATIAFSALLQRFPNLRLACAYSDLAWHNNFGFATLIELPVRLGRTEVPSHAADIPPAESIPEASAPER